MVDFTKLAQSKASPKEQALVSSGNVRGGDLNNFDKLFSQINMDGFESNLRAANRLESSIQVNPDQYVQALSMRNINELRTEIETSLDYMRQNEQYLSYQKKVKDLLKSTDCDNVGELLSKHGDSKKVIEAMTDLQSSFDSDPLMKYHYKEVLNKTQRINQNLDVNRNEVVTIGPNGSREALEADQQYLSEVQDVRGSVLDSIDSMDIPFIDDDQNDLSQNLRDSMQSDEQTIQKTNELLSNLTDNSIKNTVESPKVDRQAEPEHRKNDEGLSL